MKKYINYNGYEIQGLLQNNQIRAFIAIKDNALSPEFKTAAETMQWVNNTKSNTI